MYIDGITLSSYRSFGPDVQPIGPFDKINAFIGKNNSGKSNILRFIYENYISILDSARGGQKPSKQFNPLDRHQGRTSDKVTLGFGIVEESQAYGNYISSIETRLEGEPRALESFRKIIKSKEIKLNSNLIWFQYSATSLGGPLLLDETFKSSLENVISRDDWYFLWRKLNNSSGGDINAHWIPQSLGHLSIVHYLPKPNMAFVPAIRKVEGGNVEESNYSGVGLIDRLAKFQNPGFRDREKFGKFEAINNFVKNVTENESCSIEIPYERNLIMVHMNGKTLPLDSLGTGIHEVIILAVVATLLENSVLCIEEPELHLHPTLLRKLIVYLYNSTSNQYFITSHSSNLLDAEQVKTFHVKLINNESRVEFAESSRQKHHVCSDLGYKASDLLQSNCIIWVEGPSDRIFLTHFISKQNSSLIEGVHYSIMFYGGKLASHLSAEDPWIDKFISLRRMNRNSCIIIDSDRRKIGDRLNKTKKRLEKEFNQGPGFSWITHGREIENYFEKNVLEQAIKKAYNDVNSISKCERFDQCIRYKNSAGKWKKNLDKVKIASEVIQLNPTNARFDFLKNIRKLTEFIASVNF